MVSSGLYICLEVKPKRVAVMRVACRSLVLLAVAAALGAGQWSARIWQLVVSAPVHAHVFKAKTHAHAAPLAFLWEDAEDTEPEEPETAGHTTLGAAASKLHYGPQSHCGTARWPLALRYAWWHLRAPAHTPLFVRLCCWRL